MIHWIFIVKRMKFIHAVLILNTVDILDILRVTSISRGQKIVRAHTNTARKSNTLSALK